MRVKWLRKALTSLDEAADYIAKDNPNAACRPGRPPLGNAIYFMPPYVITSA